MLQVPYRNKLMRGEVLGREALPTLQPAWDDLCTRATESNVYYEPRYASALINNLNHDRSLHFAAVWQGDTLAALLPFTRSKIETPLFATAPRAWQTDYTFSCTPLLDRSCAVDAAAALVGLLGTINEGEWIFPTLNRHGPACRALIEALEDDGRPYRIANSFQRAVLDCVGGFDEHIQKHLSSKRRRDLARSRRRLEDIGTVAHESHRSGEGLYRAVQAFLSIESSGWKGKRGTALDCHSTTRQFALDAFTGDPENSICRADVLTLNGAPVAVGLIVFSGNTGFTVKGAYDESYRSYSVGLLLEVEVLRSFLTDRWASRLDGATNGTHVIDSLWPDAVEVVDLTFSLAARHAERRLSILAQIDRTRQTVRNTAKALAASIAAI